jgi:hypothetical protein
LVIGTLPKRLRRQCAGVGKYRRFLEGWIVEVKGRFPTKLEACVIQEASSWAIHRALCQAKLRSDYETLSARDAAFLSKEVASATTQMNLAVKKLDLDAPPPSPWETLYGPDTPTDNGNSNGPDQSTT